MGKSTPSCFKIISCGGSDGDDSVDHDDLQTPESKGSSDRRRWSFRKRSARHRVLSNSVISEAPASASKEDPESTAVNFQVQPDLTLSEKPSVIQWTEEKTELPAHPDSKLSDTQASGQDDLKADSTLDEPSIIIIQAAIRGLLAQRLLLKQKNIIKLQAVVRGHLVRRHAVGTLRCVQAIIKMQALVRARHARLLVEGSADVAKQRESSVQNKKEAKSSVTYTYVSIDKLLSNSFARQLMEATPKTKPINIKCEPLKSDSAWKWLERWMSISSVSDEEPQEFGATVEQHKKTQEYEAAVEQNKKTQVSEAAVEQHKRTQESEAAVEQHKRTQESEAAVEQNQKTQESEAAVEQNQKTQESEAAVEQHKRTQESEAAVEQHKETQESGAAVEQHKETQESAAAVEQHKENFGHSDDEEDDNLVQIISKSTGSKSGVNASAEASIDDNLTTNDTQDNLTTNDTQDLDLHSSKSTSPSSSHSRLHNNDQSNSRCDVIESAPTEMKETDLVEVVEVKYLPEEETGNDQDVPDLKMFSTEQTETEVKKISRKASNPAFIAAQSKFEELSLAATSAKLTNSSSDDPGVESRLDKVSSSTDQPIRSKDMGLADNAISNVSAVQRGASECGTELSISSTLDSPDRSDAGVNDTEMEIKASDETDHPRGRENLELEAKSTVLETDPSCTNTNKLERYESVNSVTSESLNLTTPADTPYVEKKPEADPSHLQLDLGSEASHLVNKSSPEASPRSHVTVPESQATPSSQVSVKPKKSKGEKNESNRKNRPSPADKNLSNHNQDSASRSRLEQLQEHKTGKRRNSFGSTKPDHREQEARDTSSSNSLPSYMQATESARAKAIANASPRSSPDVHDKDYYIKKRHSLPGINERQGSPRIHRSLSQAQQNAKGNATHSPQDRKWRR